MKISSSWEDNYSHLGCALHVSSEKPNPKLDVAAVSEAFSLELSQERVYALRDLLNQAISDLETKKHWAKKATAR